MSSILTVLLTVIIFAIGFLIAVQDFKKRLIDLWLVLLYISLAIVHALITSDPEELTFRLFLTVSFLILILTSTKLFQSAKNGFKNTRVLDVIGLGDLFVIFALGIFFPASSSILFFSCSFIFSLILHLIFSNARTTVPLAGYILVFTPLFFILLHANLINLE